ncbi:MAG: hypothetical protein AAFX85_11860 [Pseudomonadota bacterium]
MIKTFVELLQGLASPVLLLGVLSFALLLSFAISIMWPPSPVALVALPLLLSLFGALSKYPYALAQSAANGHRELAVASVEDFNVALNVPHLVHMGLIIGLLVVVYLGGPPAIVAALVLVLLVPASVALMATTEKLTTALSPLAVLELIGRLGATYAVLLGFLTALAIVAAVSLRVLSATPDSFLGNAIVLYALMGAFVGTGRALFMQRMVLDIVETTPQDRLVRSDRVDTTRPFEAELDRIYGLVRGGEMRRAYTALDAVLESENYHPDTYETLYARVGEWGVEPLTTELARGLVSALVEASQLQRALEVTEARLRHDASFRPHADVLPALRAHANSIGHVATASLLTSPES